MSKINYDDILSDSELSLYDFEVQEDNSEKDLESQSTEEENDEIEARVSFKVKTKEELIQQNYRPKKEQIHKSLRLTKRYANEEMVGIKKFF